MRQKDEVRLRQINAGTHLNNGYVLRTHPVWDTPGFHGNTNIQLSDAWALAEASRLRRDAEGMQLAGKQLEWVFGANPFGESLMYGVGYDFRPLHAVRFKNMVGALPVGMNCMSGDKPYWSGTNDGGTYREIWVGTVTQFLGAVSVYAFEDQRYCKRQEAWKSIQLDTEAAQSANGVVAVAITITGRGRHEIDVRAFNARLGFSKMQVDLSRHKRKRIDLELNVTDKNKPYVAVISADGDREVRKEIVRSYVDSSILQKE
jgi:hypothetical protein